VPTIEVARIKPSQIMTGPYSFYVPPYSYYYFHHMDQLGLRLDWIRRRGPVFAWQEPKAPFTTSFTYQGHTYTLEDYYQRNGEGPDASHARSRRTYSSEQSGARTCGGNTGCALCGTPGQESRPPSFAGDGPASGSAS
jgi:hypothetical protein